MSEETVVLLPASEFDEVKDKIKDIVTPYLESIVRQLNKTLSRFEESLGTIKEEQESLKNLINSLHVRINDSTITELCKEVQEAKEAKKDFLEYRNAIVNSATQIEIRLTGLEADLKILQGCFELEQRARKREKSQT